MPDPNATTGSTGHDNHDQHKKRHIDIGDAPVPLLWTIAAAFLLILITVAVLYSITTQWPVCELPEDTTNAAAAANENTSRPAPPAANSNTTATPGANANVAPTNTNANAGGATNTNARTGAVSPSPATSPVPASGGNTAALDADGVEPVSGPIYGNTLVTIRGKNFGSTNKGMVVKFGEREAQVNQVGDKSISVRTPRHSEGLVDITVEKGAESDVLPSAYTYTCPAPTGSGLFIMLIMAGALGGCIHSLRSLYWYSGQGELKWRWLPMYFILPFIGAGMAMIFSLLIFAGFVDNTTGRSQALFIIAAAGLVGMFSQQASLKLTDVANAFFTKPGEGKDAEPQRSVSVSEAGRGRSTPLTVTAVDKTVGKPGDEVTITGTGFSTSTMVSFGVAAASIKSLTPTSITVITPPHEKGEVDVEVKSGDQVAKPAKFTYE